MIKIDKDTVKKMADLAMLDLKSDEIVRFEKELESILGYVEKINEVDVSSISDDYESHIDIKNVMRQDIPEEGLSQKKAVSQTKNKGGYIVAPNVI